MHSTLHEERGLELAGHCYVMLYKVQCVRITADGCSNIGHTENGQIEVSRKHTEEIQTLRVRLTVARERLLQSFTL